jgi:hypothetical protein
VTRHRGWGVDPLEKDSEDEIFRSLEGWASQVDRRARRAQVGRRLVRATTSPVRMVRRHPVVVIITLIVAFLATLIVRYTFRDPVQPYDSRTYNAQPYDGQRVPVPDHAVAPFATSTATAQPSGPFVNTPAARWAEGEAGISMPAAIAVDGFSEADVAADLATVRKALIAGRLDHRMLVDGDPSTFLALLAPDVRSAVNNLFQANQLPFLVSVIDQSARLAAFPPRVFGRTAFASTREGGQLALAVVTNYVWVYPFDNGQVVLIHDSVIWRFISGGTGGGARPGSYASYAAFMNCAAYARGRLAPALPGEADFTSRDDNPDSYYDPDRSFAAAQSCTRPPQVVA